MTSPSYMGSGPAQQFNPPQLPESWGMEQNRIGNLQQRQSNLWGDVPQQQYPPPQAPQQSSQGLGTSAPSPAAPPPQYQQPQAPVNGPGWRPANNMADIPRNQLNGLYDSGGNAVPIGTPMLQRHKNQAARPMRWDQQMQMASRDYRRQNQMPGDDLSQTIWGDPSQAGGVGFGSQVRNAMTAAHSLDPSIISNLVERYRTFNQNPQTQASLYNNSRNILSNYSQNRWRY